MPPTAAQKRRPRPPPRPSYTSRPHAEDEDPFGREEALQDHQGWQGLQGHGSACRKNPHPAEEEPEEEASDGQRSSRDQAGPAARQGAPGEEVDEGQAFSPRPQEAARSPR